MPASDYPLVSAIMPTTGQRARFWPCAVESFQSQDWPNKELIIMASEGWLQHEMPNVVSAVYCGKENIGEKRNAACYEAAGEYIVHWDDDDWSAPHRITDQIERLILNRGLAVTGYHSCLFWDGEKVFEYEYLERAIGSSLCYRKDYWERNKFMPVVMGEDNRFMLAAKAQGHFVGAPGSEFLVCRIHAGNTSPKNVRASNYHSRPVSMLPADFPRAI